jgi:DNA-binding NarL/FixJ family response regulator
MKIALFDDHLFVVNTLSDFLKQQEGIEIAGIATNTKDILRILEDNEVDILISDVLTDEEIGLGLFEEIQARKFPIQIIVYSSINSDFVKHFLFDYGVVAFVNKKEPLENLWQAMQLVFYNTRYQVNGDSEPPPKLTPKEVEIARYLAKGLAAKEIAVLTSSSVNTINNQKNNLLLKFNCSNSTELTLKLLQMGYLKL